MYNLALTCTQDLEYFNRINNLLKNLSEQDYQIFARDWNITTKEVDYLKSEADNGTLNICFQNIVEME